MLRYLSATTFCKLAITRLLSTSTMLLAFLTAFLHYDYPHISRPFVCYVAIQLLLTLVQQRSTCERRIRKVFYATDHSSSKQSDWMTINSQRFQTMSSTQFFSSSSSSASKAIAVRVLNLVQTNQIFFPVPFFLLINAVVATAALMERIWSVGKRGTMNLMVDGCVVKAGRYIFSRHLPPGRCCLPCCCGIA